jgi:hypothetical protein
MANTPTVGNRAALLDAQGTALAADTRAAIAPNQRTAEVLPPEMLGAPRVVGRGADKQVARRQDGTASQERDHRFMGANSITLRREMQRRGIEDPRFVTVQRAGWINRENNISAAVLKPGAQPIELVSSPGRGDHAVALKHQKEEMGFTERGAAGGQVMRPKDSDVFDDKGQHVTETRQARGRQETYQAYSVTDVNVANLRDRKAPGEGRSQVERWQKDNDGRDPDFDAIRGGMAQRKMGAMIETLGQKHGVTIKTDVARLPEAQFSLDAKGQGTLQVPKGSAFRDLNHQVSSVMQAVAHSTLAREAQRQVAAAPADQPHEAAAARVAGYQLSPSKQAKSSAFAEADLVASYAALHETTGLGLNYNPSPNVSNVEMQERWAQKLAEPGGYASVDRQITRTLKLDEELLPARTPGRFKTREQLAQPEHAGRSAQDITARAAAGLRQERRSASDDSVPPPPERPGSATQTQAAAARTQAKGQDAPDKPAR